MPKQDKTSGFHGDFNENSSTICSVSKGEREREQMEKLYYNRYTVLTIGDKVPKKDFTVNKSVSLPLGLAQVIVERAEEYNRSFSEELTSLVRLGLKFHEVQAMREEERAREDAEKVLKSLA